MKQPNIQLSGLTVVLALCLILQWGCGRTPASGGEPEAATSVPEAVVPAPGGGSLPRLLDLGAKQCVPCRMMAPILEDLATNHASQFETVFIDVWENPEPGKEHNVSAIPTQIFFDEGGKELFRHEGFYSKEQILAKWRELGYDFSPSSGG